MLNRILLSLLALCLMVGLKAQDEFGPGEYMEQTFSDLSDKLSLYANSGDYGWRENLCFAGAIIDLGETIALDVYLEAGKSYSFIGGGDEDVTILDLYIVNSNGEVLVSDILDDRTPIVDFSPEATAQYSLRMQLVGCEAGISFIGLAMLEQGGASFDADGYEEAYTNLLTNSTNVNKTSNGVAYHSTDNQWSTFGFWLSPNEVSSIDNMNLAGGSTNWLVSGSQETLSNTDLFLLDADGKQIDADEDGDNYPLMSNSNLSATQNYSVRVKAVGGINEGLMLFSVLEE